MKFALIDGTKPLQTRLLLAVFIALPLLALIFVLRSLMVQQIENSYDSHLQFGTQSFELILQNKFIRLREALSGIAADNTIQITLKLGIVPQLRRYLDQQFKLSPFSFVAISSDHQAILAQTGKIPEAFDFQQQCSKSSSIWQNETDLYLLVALPISGKKQQLGTVCGGIQLNDLQSIKALKAQLNANPIIWLNDKAYGGDAFYHFVDQEAPSGRYVSEMNGHEYIYLVRRIKLGEDELDIGVFIEPYGLQKQVDQVMYFIGAILLLFLFMMAIGIRSISQRCRAELALADERASAVSTLTTIGEAVLTLDTKGRVRYINPAALALLGISESNASKKHWSSLIKLVDDQTGESVTDPVVACIEQNARIDSDDHTALQTKQERLAVKFSVNPVGNREGEQSGCVLVLHDVQQERQLQRSLVWRAERDDLTQLYNRNAFYVRVETAMEEARTHGVSHCLLFVDLDKFKIVNDSCGHRAGDTMLNQIVYLLQTRLRKSDVLARLGGDEFGILLSKCDLAKGMHIATQLREVVNDYRFIVDDKSFTSSISAGFVMIDSDSPGVEETLSQADAACYRAKELGRDQIHLFDKSEADSSFQAKDKDWLPRIRSALTEDRFELYLQPIVGAFDENQASYLHGEILLRMIDEDNAIVPPGSFLPVAERYGMTTEIDRWVVERLFQQAQAVLQQHDKDDYRYSINLAASSISDVHFASFVVNKLHQYQIPGKAICFEITETAAISHLDNAGKFMREMKALGCQFMLDDFGSGMSSYAYLKTLPVDYLKIDGLFVKDIVDDPIDRKIVSSINDVTHILEMKSVAEFVENQHIADLLRSLSIDYLQGYGIAKPSPLSEILAIQSHSD